MVDKVIHLPGRPLRAAWEQHVAAALTRWMRPPASLMHFYWVLFAVSIGCFAIHRALGSHLGPLAPVFAIVGVASCGWSWLLARAIFHPQDAASRWPVWIVIGIFMSGAVLIVSGSPEAGRGFWWPLRTMIVDVHLLTSSTVLLLALIEPIRGIGASPTADERRLRLAFACGYGALLAASVLWAPQASDTAASIQVGDGVQIACGVLAVIAGRAAIWAREAITPVKDQGRGDSQNKIVKAQDDDDLELAAQLKHIISQEAFFTTHDVKVADLAKRVGKPEYKVTRCITGTLGFRNFNQLINTHRIECAKHMLADRSYDGLSILDVALESGFGSIGPFNRAFKDQMNMTPREYRAASRSIQ